MQDARPSQLFVEFREVAREGRGEERAALRRRAVVAGAAPALCPALAVVALAFVVECRAHPVAERQRPRFADAFAQSNGERRPGLAFDRIFTGAWAHRAACRAGV